MPKHNGCESGNRAASHERRDNWDVEQFRKSKKRLCGSCLEDSATRVDDGAFCSDDQLRRIFDERRITIKTRVVPSEIDRIRPVPIERRVRVRGIDEIFRNVDKHGARTARGRYMECLAHDARNVRSVRHEFVVLRNRTSDSNRIDFLERVGSDACSSNLSGDNNHWNRIHVRISEWRDDVRCGRTTGDHCDARTAGCMRVALGHMACTLFVTNKNVANGRVDDRVVDRQDCATGQTKDHIDTLEFESLDECGTTVGFHGCPPRCLGISGIGPVRTGGT